MIKEKIERVKLGGIFLLLTFRVGCCWAADAPVFKEVMVEPKRVEVGQPINFSCKAELAGFKKVQILLFGRQTIPGRPSLWTGWLGNFNGAAPLEVRLENFKSGAFSGEGEWHFRCHVYGRNEDNEPWRHVGDEWVIPGSEIEITMPSFADDPNLIWQIGTIDNSFNEFIPMYSSDFVHNDEMANNPGFNLQEHSFTYQVPESRFVIRPALPMGLGTENGILGYSDKIVKKIGIAWVEQEAGFRTLEIHTADYRKTFFNHPAQVCEMDNYGDDLKVIYPGNKESFFQMPLTYFEAGTTPLAKGTADLNWKKTFAVKQGTNNVLLEMVNTSRADHIYFDALRLVKAKGPEDFKPVIDFSTDKLGNVFFEDQPPIIKVQTYNLTPGEKYSVKSEIRDYWHNIVDKAERQITPSADGSSEDSIPFSGKGRGYFEASFSLWQGNKLLSLDRRQDTIAVPYARIIRPLPPDPIADEDSPYGVHIWGSGYQDTRYPERVEKLTGLAELSGARWQRQLGFVWNYIEPEKGKFVWEHYDKVVAIYRKHNFRILGTLVSTPGWARKDPEHTYSVNQYYEVPKTEDWYTYVFNIVSHYKNDIKYWEIENEPSPRAQWGGLAPDYAEFLTTAYKAAKAADPDAQIVAGTFCLSSTIKKFCEDWLTQSGPNSFDVANMHYPRLGGPYGTMTEFLDFMKVHKLSQPLWDTEDHIRSPELDLEGEASEMVKLYLRNQSFGVKKVFFFTVEMCFIRQESDLLVTPLLVAYRTMTHRLGGATYFGSIHPAEDVEAYLFQKEGACWLVLWNNTDCPRTIDLAVGEGKASFVDIMDNEKTITPQQGKVAINVNKIPVFICLKNTDALVNQMRLKLFPKEAICQQGTEVEVKAKLENPRAQTWEGEVSLKAPEGWRISAGDKTEFTLLPGRGVDIAFNVNIPGDAGHAVFEIPVVVTSSNGEVLSDVFKVITQSVPVGTNLLVKPTDLIPVFPDEVYGFSFQAAGKDVRGKARLIAYNERKEAVSETDLVPYRVPEGSDKFVGICRVEKGVSAIGLKFLTEKGDARISESEGFVLSKADFSKSKLKYRGVCVKAKEVPALIGNEADWDNAKPLVLNRPDQVRKHHFSGALWDTKPFDWGGPDDLSGTAYTMWDDQNFYLAVKVKDDKYCPRGDWGDSPPPWLWCGYDADGIQVTLDPDNEAKTGGFFILTINEMDRGSVYLTLPEGFLNYAIGRSLEMEKTQVRRLSDAQVKVTLSNDNQERFYEVIIPLGSIPDFKPRPGKPFGFDIAINEDDGAGHRGWIDWAPRMVSPYWDDPGIFGMLVVTR